MATDERLIEFGPFRLEPAHNRLSRAEVKLRLRPTAVAVLRYLAERPGQVVSKAELLEHVWSGTYVSKTVLKVCVCEIRDALGEEAAAPRYIETIGRVGYRFIGSVTGAAPATGPQPDLEVQPIHLARSGVVGRDEELAQLQGYLDTALRGDRQVVFVIGEPGIGKTTVVDALLVRAAGAADLWIARGQCVEQHGAGEAYLPILEALGSLCRAADGDLAIGVLRRHAPTWLVQMSSLVDDREIEALQRKVSGATQERMMREMADALEALTAARPLLLWLEDLQWSDYSTVDLVRYLGERRQAARLLLLGTYRPTEVVLSGHPIKGLRQELQARRRSQELVLELLGEPAVEQYLRIRLGAAGDDGMSLRELAGVIHQRTDGNPLFMVNLVEYCVRNSLLGVVDGRWALKEAAEHLRVPESLRHMIEKRLEGLGAEERRILEAASVVGAEFTVAAVAAAVHKDVETVEDHCEEAAGQRYFFEERGIAEWPDGTVSGRYRFRHALYQQVLYEGVAAARRVKWHRQIGEREEAGYGRRAGEIAAGLAMHFERGRDDRRAVQYLGQAAHNALGRSAVREAITLATHGLTLLGTLPDTVERIQSEIMLQLTLGGALTVSRGFAAPEVAAAYARAQQLCQQAGDIPALFPVLQGLFRSCMVRADLHTIL